MKNGRYLALLGFAFLATLNAAACPVAAQEAHPNMSPAARLAETRLRVLLNSTSAISTIDYSKMTTEVAKVVRNHPENEPIVKLGIPQKIQFLGDPPGCHLFRLTYATAKIDFIIALNAEGKISAMYYHPAVDSPS